MEAANRTSSFGYWLRRHRKARDLTQAQLADLVGCSRAMLRKIEADERRPSAALAESLADTLALGAAERRTFLAVARREAAVDHLPLPTAPAPASDAAADLPLPPTPLHGRERDLASLLALLHEPSVRCVTLVGPGGVGKTRLALAAADALRRQLGSIWFVSLAPITAPELLMQTIALALGLRGRTTPAAQLRSRLRGGRTVLVLDNLEQLVAAAGQLAQLLAAIPGLRLLITSRAPLRIAAERIVEVLPLALPPEHGGSVSSWQELAGYPAAALFLERYAAVRPDPSLSTADYAAIPQIVRRLDGLPLAIELAAARGRLLQPRDLLAQLDDALHVLGGGPRDLPARQRTLRDTVQWSYDLIDPDARRTFERLAVFRGGFDLEAAAAIDPPPLVIGRLETLLDASLIRRTEGPSGRLAMFETIAEFARERLTVSGELGTARARHARWCFELGRRAEVGLRGAVRLAWMDRLEHELHNLREALGWAIRERNDLRGGLLLAAGLRQFWHVRGRHGEGRAWIAAACEQIGPDAPDLRGRALLAEGYLAWFQREYTVAAQALEPAVVLLGAAGDAAARIEAVAMLAMCASSLPGGQPRAAALAAEAADLAAEHGEPWAIGMARFWQGVIAANAGDADAADYARASIAAFDRAGDAWNGGPHSTLGDLARARGEYAAAREHYEAALGCFRAIGDKWGCAFALRVLAEHALHTGQAGEALPLARESLALWRELGDRRAQSGVLQLLAAIERGHAGS